MYSACWVDLPGPVLWHHETLARLLTFCTLRFNDPAYMDAWAESHSAVDYAGKTPTHDYAVTSALQALPWVQAKLWNATLTESSIRIRPLHFGPRTPQQGRLMSPDGLVEVEWSDEGQIIAPPHVDIDLSLAEAASVLVG
jgi:hypothetical protein